MSFAATITEWGQAELDRAEAIFQAAAQTVANEVRNPLADGGRMPIKTGNLRRSLMASTSEMPLMKPETTTFTDQGVEMVIAGVGLGGAVYLGFQAAYAARMNYGFVGEDSLGRAYNQAGFGFVDAVAQRWSEIVREAEQTVRSRFDHGGS